MTVIDKKGREIFTKELLHTGEVINQEIKARKLKKKDVAKELGISPSNLSEILYGKRHVGTAIAIKLETIFDIKAEYWLTLQMNYYLQILRQNKNKKAKYEKPPRY